MQLFQFGGFFGSLFVSMSASFALARRAPSTLPLRSPAHCHCARGACLCMAEAHGGLSVGCPDTGAEEELLLDRVGSGEPWRRDILVVSVVWAVASSGLALDLE